MLNRVYVWDIFVRLFHWSLVVAFAANAIFIDEESNLHLYVGYFVAALLAARLVWGLVGSRHARFSDFWPSPMQAFGQLRDMITGRRQAHAGHSPLGALMIYNLLATIAGIALSGYMMTTVDYFGVEWVEEIHEVLVTWAEISIVLHIAAVIFESRRLRVNLPASMVTGYKDLPS
jgi:cytochrome b